MNRIKIMEHLRGIEHVPSVPFQTVPPDYIRIETKELDVDSRGIDSIISIY